MLSQVPQLPESSEEEEERVFREEQQQKKLGGLMALNTDPMFSKYHFRNNDQ